MRKVTDITKFLYFLVAFSLLFVRISADDNVVTISKNPSSNTTDVVNLAQGRHYSLRTLPSEYYPDLGKLLLTDGKRGKKEDLECGERLCAPGWVGFENSTPVITVDLEQGYQLQKISASFLDYPTKGVTPPAAVRLQTSFDGIHWTPRGSLKMREGSVFDIDKASFGARYVRLIVERNQWVFLDEIEIFGSGTVAFAPSEPNALKHVLVVTNEPDADDERQLRLANLLDGMGIPFDLINTKQLDSIEFLDYQLLIFAGSSKIQLKINYIQQQRIITAIHSGTNVLWIGAGIWGSFKNTELADVFGIRYIKQDSNEGLGVRFAAYRNLAEASERLPLKHETMWVVQTTDAVAEGWFLDDDARPLDIPFITRSLGKLGCGTTLYIALPLLDRWKADETPDTFARAEILTKSIRSLLADGVVGRHPVADAKDAVFMLRLEDYTPGGLNMGHTERSWLMGMDHLLALTEKYQVPLNIAVIPKYNYPYLGEYHDWGEQDSGIIQLKHQAETAFLRGGSLIVHGFDHQNGNAIDDYSGDDWETWDEDSEVFLPLLEQKVITDSAYAEIEKHWGVKPVIWETPHYISNKDTFKAAHASGFHYFTESDTKIFPNWNGYQNNSNGLMLNIPETGAFFQLGTAEVKQKALIKQLYVLPRIVRMNALFLVFYHNLSSAMHRALDNVLVSSNNYNLWKPNMEQYANFWEQRKQVKIDVSIDRKRQQIHTLVQDSFEGFTLAIQLPAGKTPVSVTVDGHQREVKKRKISGAWILYPVLKDGVHDVVVNYQ